MSPLYLAAQEGHTSCVRKLLSAKGIDINAHQNGAQGDTALHVAIKKHRVDIVELLVELGADVNAVNDQNESGLMIIMRSLWFDTALLMINKLIDFGARTNAVNDDGNNVFMIGVSRNDLPSIALEAFRILFKNGTDIFLQNTIGKSALVLAAETNNVMVAEYLLQCLVEIRIHNSSGLHNSVGLHFFTEIYASLQEASRKGHEKIVSLLLKFIDNGKGSYGRYPTAVSDALHEAKQNVISAQTSASSEGQAKSYWDIYSMLLQHSR
jgi:ankyrin repeat protein